MKIKGRWHLIVVAALVVSSGGAVIGCQPAPPVVLKFSSSPTEVDAGDSAVLTWVVKDATSVSIDHGIGVVANAGNKEVSPSETTTYTLFASNSGGAVAESVVITVDATSPPDSDTTAPVITSVLASSVTGTSAVIAWTTDEAATSQVEYGTSTDYGSSTPHGELATSHSVTVSGLDGETTYHYRVKSQDGAGNEAVSTDETFTTSAEADTTAPSISNVFVLVATESSAAITWRTDELGSSQVEYGTTTDLGTFAPSTPANDPTSGTSIGVSTHSVALTGLTHGTTYYYKVRSKDGAGNEAMSEVDVFEQLGGGEGPVEGYAPQLLSPNNGCIGVPTYPASFSWSPWEGSTRYKFQLAKDAAMTDVIAEDHPFATAYEYNGTLDYSTNYFWRVMAVEPAPSDWSETFSFQTAAAP